MNKIGFHISSEQGANSGWLQKFNSAAHLVLATGVGGEVPRLLQVAEACPTSRIIYRAWSVFSPGDSDHFEWYYRDHGTDPLPFIKRHEPVLDAISAHRHHISIQAFNETGHDEGSWKNFIEFNRRYVEELDKRGFSASVLGLGPGHPAWSGPDARESIRRAWQQAKPLFEQIINSQQTHIINLHEYCAVPFDRKDAAGNTIYMPWIIGKYLWMLDDIRAMGLPTEKIKVFIGESGYTDPGALNIPSPAGPNGFRWSMNQGYTPEQVAEDYVRMVKQVYDPSPNLVGLAYFCLGDSGGWKEFDLLQEPRILERMLQMVISEPTWEVVVTPEKYFTVVADVLRVRFAPTLSAQVLDNKVTGDVVKTNGYVDFDGYRWRQLVDSAGYCAEYSLSTLEPLMKETIVTPVPDWKTEVLAQIALIRQEIDELQSLIIQAP